MMNTVRPVGDFLREWRQRRRLSQLDLALDADISTRHLSFMETGRSLPSRDMVLRLAGIDAALLQPPANVLRLSLHPDGLAPRIANYAQWRAHLFERLRRQIEVSGDSFLADLLNELGGYPAPGAAATQPPAAAHDFAGVVVPFQLATDNGTLSFISTTTVFGTPVDVTLSELALESFFPADAATAQALRQLAASSGTDHG